jgi:hypothetical protein
MYMWVVRLRARELPTFTLGNCLTGSTISAPQRVPLHQSGTSLRIVLTALERVRSHSLGDGDHR